MRIYSETGLRNFKPWAGARYVYEMLDDDELDMLEDCIAEIYPEGIEDVHLNDILWFDGDWVAMVLGYKDLMDMEKQKRSEEDDGE